MLDITIGDARLAIEREPDGRFDLLIMDAFSSDAVPNASAHQGSDVALYGNKLSENGILDAPYLEPVS